MSSSRMLLCILAAIAAIAPMRTLAHAQGGGRPPASVRVARVESETLAERRRVTGQLKALAQSRLASIEEGLVVELPIDAGRAVRAGDILAVLDSRRLALELRRQESQLKVAQAVAAARARELDLTRSDLDAMRAMRERQASNPKELANAESEHAVAEARKVEADESAAVLQAEIDLLGIRLDDMTIRAPFDGVVVAKHTERGEWIGVGDPIAEVVARGAYEAWLDVPQRYAAAVIGGDQAVVVRVDATDRLIEAKRPNVVPVVDPAARTFGIWVRIDDPEGILGPGMSVTGWIPTGREGTYLTVPRDAILRNERGFFVFVAREQSEGPALAAPTQIDVLYERGDDAVVEPGALREGDLVVVEGNERLFPLAPIAYGAPSARAD